MKRIFIKIILLALAASLALFLLSACGGKDVTLTKDEVWEANTTKKLLENYKSVMVDFSYSSDNYGYYVEKELGYYWYDDYGEITVGDVQRGEDEYGAFTNFYVGSETDVSFFESLSREKDVFYAEEIVSCKQKGDEIKLKTKITLEKMAQLGYSYSEEMLEEGYYSVEYTLDAETLVIRSIVEKLMLDGIGIIDIQALIVRYDAERPEKAEELFTAYKNGTEKMTVTAVFALGTYGEKAYKEEFLKGDYVFFYIDEGYEVYRDRECTQPFDYTTKLYKDTTVYIAPITE